MQRADQQSARKEQSCVLRPMHVFGMHYQRNLRGFREATGHLLTLESKKALGEIKKTIASKDSKAKINNGNMLICTG